MVVLALVLAEGWGHLEEEEVRARGGEAWEAAGHAQQVQVVLVAVEVTLAAALFAASIVVSVSLQQEGRAREAHVGHQGSQALLLRLAPCEEAWRHLPGTQEVCSGLAEQVCLSLLVEE